ncbi:hypothetical protein CLIB1423_21S02014 [[Candida] railenensis]|uniref:HMG box domain-containing protein n=1 Tax=[Candida] railenensis TaxID=45579 RepID=A0A9P0QU60_9ASCO|nr:hypothetical protein CLIB1423_21S02014 [[Candida] railenensis]
MYRSLNRSLYVSFRRYSSAYIREPFRIGYPRGFNQEAIGRIRNDVFPSEKLSPLDYFIKEGNDEQSWADLNLYERSKYVNMVSQGEHKYTSPKPELSSGYNLFRALNKHIRSKKTADVRWSRLSNKGRETYTKDANFIEKAHRELVRQWEGWEIVEYLKNGNFDADAHSKFNPFPYSGLYPWEVITDKLISGRKYQELFEFEADYYDRLIYEAFSGRSRCINDMYRDDTDAKTASGYAKLSASEKLQYEARHLRRLNHLEKNRLTSSPISPFMQFVRQLKKEDSNSLLPYRKLVSKAGELWRELSPEEKAPYKRDINPNSLEYVHGRLQQKVEITMSYIFEVGGVEGVDASYDWKEDMESKERWKRVG